MYLWVWHLVTFASHCPDLTWPSLTSLLITGDSLTNINVKPTKFRFIWYQSDVHMGSVHKVLAISEMNLTQQNPQERVLTLWIMAISLLSKQRKDRNYHLNNMFLDLTFIKCDNMILFVKTAFLKYQETNFFYHFIDEILYFHNRLYSSKWGCCMMVCMRIHGSLLLSLPVARISRSSN